VLTAHWLIVIGRMSKASMICGHDSMMWLRCVISHHCLPRSWRWCIWLLSVVQHSVGWHNRRGLACDDVTWIRRYSISGWSHPSFSRKQEERQRRWCRLSQLLSGHQMVIGSSW